jgi:hypothetical protein
MLSSNIRLQRFARVGVVACSPVSRSNRNVSVAILTGRRDGIDENFLCDRAAQAFLS